MDVLEFVVLNPSILNKAVAISPPLAFEIAS
jgi:hypothetical protein